MVIPIIGLGTPDDVSQGGFNFTLANGGTKYLALMLGQHLGAQAVDAAKILAEGLPAGEWFITAPSDNVLLGVPPHYEAGRGFFLFPKSQRVFPNLDANGVPIAETMLDVEMSYLTGLGHAMVDGQMRVDAFQEKPGEKPYDPNQVFEMLLSYGMKKWYAERFGGADVDVLVAKRAFLNEFRSRFVNESKLKYDLQRNYVQENILLAFLLAGEKGRQIWNEMYGTSKAAAFRGGDRVSLELWSDIRTNAQEAVKASPELREFLEGLMKYVRFTNLNTFYFAFDGKVADVFLDKTQGYEQPLANPAEGTFFAPRRKGMELDWSSHVLTPMMVTKPQWMSPTYYTEKQKKLFPDVEEWADLWNIANAAKTAAGGSLSAAPFGPFWFDTGKVQDIERIVRMAMDEKNLWDRLFIRSAFRLPLFDNEVGAQYPKDRIEFSDPENYMMINSSIEVPAGVRVKIGKGVWLDHAKLVIDAKAGETVVIPDGTILAAVRVKGQFRGTGTNRYFYHYMGDRGIDFDRQPRFISNIHLKDIARPVTVSHAEDVDPKSAEPLNVQLADGTPLGGYSFAKSFFPSDKNARVFDFAANFNALSEHIQTMRRSEIRSKVQILTDLVPVMAKRETLPAKVGGIVIFGSSSKRVTPEAARMYKEGKAPWILVSGRYGKDVKEDGKVEPEALIFKKELMAQGVPEEAIILEDQSRDMTDNAVKTADLLKAKGLSPESVIFLHGPYHVLRGAQEFRRALAKAGLSTKVYEHAGYVPDVAGMSAAEQDKIEKMMIAQIGKLNSDVPEIPELSKLNELLTELLGEAASPVQASRSEARSMQLIKIGFLINAYFRRTDASVRARTIQNLIKGFGLLPEAAGLLETMRQRRSGELD
ncbi:MAG: YdcF family protein, partial [Candidatus Omnitrophota bacterium]